MGSPFLVGHHPNCLDHDPGQAHTDRPERLLWVLDALGERGTEAETPDPIDPAAAAVVHDPDYLQRIQSVCKQGQRVDGDTVASPGTWPAVLAGAGAARWAVDRSLETDGVAFALTRPPGHHALTDRAMGFCFINNAAVAAEHALDRPGVDRVAILDWDVHHGNGTQALFAERADVAYLSIHQSELYPGTGHVDWTGIGAGEGTTANLPLPEGAGGPAYRAAAEDLLEPFLERFDPDLLVSSAGFDAHEADPISDLSLSTEEYGWLVGWTRDAAAAVDAPVAAVLEGGYQPGLLADSVAEAACAVEDGTPAPPEGEPIEPARRALDDAREAWPALADPVDPQP